MGPFCRRTCSFLGPRRACRWLALALVAFGLVADAATANRFVLVVGPTPATGSGISIQTNSGLYPFGSEFQVTLDGASGERTLVLRDFWIPMAVLPFSRSFAFEFEGQGGGPPMAQRDVAFVLDVATGSLRLADGPLALALLSRRRGQLLAREPFTLDLSTGPVDRPFCGGPPPDDPLEGSPIDPVNRQLQLVDSICLSELGNVDGFDSVVTLRLEGTLWLDCNDNIDNDGDGLEDLDDNGCLDAFDDSEESGCGDGHLDPGEECDDGNALAGDCCSRLCTFEPPGTSCDDGDACNLETACNDRGVCEGGAPLECDDGRACNGVESCDPVRGCVAGEIEDDGIGCTVAECAADADEVVHVPKHGACDDGLYCTGVERCDAVLDCLPGEPIEVDDGVACTADRCDEELDAVVNAADHGRCSDELFCNGIEVCDLTYGCRAGAPLGVDDGVACTVDECDEAADAIVHLPRPERCDDGLYCNGAERCDEALGCVDGNPPSLPPVSSCGVARCDERADLVEREAFDALCDDGDDCTADLCSAGSGCRHEPVEGCLPPVSSQVLFEDHFDTTSELPLRDESYVGDGEGFTTPLVDRRGEGWYGGRIEKGKGTIGGDLLLLGSELPEPFRLNDAACEDRAAFLLHLDTRPYAPGSVEIHFDWATRGKFRRAERGRAGWTVGRTPIDEPGGPVIDDIVDGVLLDFREAGAKNDEFWSRWTEFPLDEGGLSDGRPASERFSLPSGEESLWVAFWSDGGENDQFAFDNVRVDGRIEVEILCGNGRLDTGEGCDDGNREAGDGCSPQCERDADADAIRDAIDVCPARFDPGQHDQDGDGQGDVCDPDRDGDGIADASDVCPVTADADQADSDGDGIGDACDDSARDAADLAPVAVYGPGEYTPGDVPALYAAIKNRGDGVRGDLVAEVTFYASEDASIAPGGDIVIGACRIAEVVAPGELAGCAPSDPMEIEPALAAPGTVAARYWGACVAAEDGIPDAEPGNDCGLGNGFFAVPEPGAAPLAVAALSVLAWLARRPRRAQPGCERRADGPIARWRDLR